MICSDLYYSIYSYLDPGSKLKCGIACKRFNTFLSRDIEIAKNNLRDELKNISDKYDGFNSTKIISSLLRTNVNTKLLGPGYIAVRSFNDYICVSNIDVYDMNGSKKLELIIDYNCTKRNRYSQKNYFVTSCMYDCIGFYESYRINRYEYYINKKYVGINCLRDDEIENDPLVKKIYEAINKYLIIDKIYPSIYKLIKMEGTGCCADFVKSSELTFDDELFNFLESYPSERRTLDSVTVD
jgi:hypothetical protein